jgi:hypothetical protein
MNLETFKNFLLTNLKITFLINIFNQNIPRSTSIILFCILILTENNCISFEKLKNYYNEKIKLGNFSKKKIFNLIKKYMPNQIKLID